MCVCVRVVGSEMGDGEEEGDGGMVPGAESSSKQVVVRIVVMFVMDIMVS